MLEPNFSELQLQHLINSEITIRLIKAGKGVFLPTIVSLPEEGVLGWDSAFSVGWLGSAPDPDHYGCDLFIQYKLADFLEGARAGQFWYWAEPYFRFSIPHKTRDKFTRVYYDDFHQFHLLRELAAKNHFVCYAANRTVHRDELFDRAKRLILLDTEAFIPIGRDWGEHRYVSYLATGMRVGLHSTPQPQLLARWEDLLRIPGESAQALSETVAVLDSILRERVPGSELSLADRREVLVQRAARVVEDLRRYFGVFWYRWSS